MIESGRLITLCVGKEDIQHLVSTIISPSFMQPTSNLSSRLSRNRRRKTGWHGPQKGAHKLLQLLAQAKQKLAAVGADENEILNCPPRNTVNCSVLNQARSLGKNSIVVFPSS
jgi:hypothetical protein